METQVLLLLFPVLTSFQSLTYPDRRMWDLEECGIFNCSSFLVDIAQSPKAFHFLSSNFIWKAKLPFKVKAFMKTVALNIINTNDLF